MVSFASGFFVLVVFSLALVSAGCAKRSRVDESTNTQREAQHQEANQPATLSPHLLPTLKGDIERASLAISMAREAAKN